MAKDPPRFSLFEKVLPPADCAVSFNSATKWPDFNLIAGYKATTYKRERIRYPNISVSIAF